MTHLRQNIFATIKYSPSRESHSWLIDIEEIYQWCIDNLDSPVYIIATRYNRDNKLMLCGYRVWRRITKNLRNIVGLHGVLDRTKFTYWLTFQFGTEADRVLFTLRWGSVPFSENKSVYNAAARLPHAKLEANWIDYR